MNVQAVERERFNFTNDSGHELAALLERPAGAPPVGFALFAHCFTCSKDIAAASRISRSLAAHGFGVVRFDFTGIGNSDGDFANTNFSSNVEDLIAAAQHMSAHLQAPSLLVGHSLGGAAVLAAAARLPEVRAVATIGAPANPDHVTHLFADSRAEIETEGEAEVNLGGRTFTVKRQFLEDLAGQRLDKTFRSMRKALLVFHSPSDEIVNIDNASRIFQAAMHPKSFVSLDRADHLLSRREDSEYVAQTLAAWASRYVGTAFAVETPQSLATGDVLVREVDGKFAQQIWTDKHTLRADEPRSFGGAETGPSPYEYLLAGLGACTSMTLRMYATRRKLKLERVSVKLTHAKVHAKDCEECETKEGKVDVIDREISLEGDLTSEERDKLAAIADRCPVHRSLETEVRVRTVLS